MTTTPTPQPAAVATPEPPRPPTAPLHPKELQIHGHRRVDNYNWLKDRSNAEVIRYHEAENRFADASLAHTKPLQERLYEEIVARIPQTDQSVPYLLDGYFY